MAYATVADVEVRYGRPLTVSEAAQVTAWIEDLESEILERIPDLYDLIVAGRPTSATVRRVLCSAVIRKLDNPKGLKSRTEAIDDYSVTEQPWIQGPAGYLGLTDEDWSLLLPGSSGDTFTIRPTGEPGWATDPDVWLTS